MFLTHLYKICFVNQYASFCIYICMRKFSKYIINKDNLEYNVSLIKRLLKNKVKLCAVVKADAYGIGVDNVCPVIGDYVDYYAVSNVDEALEIRSLGITSEVLILGIVPLDCVDICAENNITIQISSYDYIKGVLNNLHSSVKVHIAVNTGLNRYGVKTLKEMQKILELIDTNKNKINLTGIFTHFATKSNDIEYMLVQKDIFSDYCRLVPNNCIKHCANSFATLYSSTMQMDMVRVGANLYGDVRAEKLPLKDVVSITSEIVNIVSVKKGQTVGYDRTFTAPNNCKIAVIPLGYADGINRKLSNRYHVLVNGMCANIVGNICMDCLMIDVTNIPNVYIGTEVVILGSQYGKTITLMDMAKVLSTSPYDVLLGLRKKRMEVVIKSKDCK